MTKSVLILGAASDIAIDCARIYASQGYDLILGLRDKERLLNFSNNLQNEFDIICELVDFDVLDTDKHKEFVENLEVIPTGVLCAVGYLGNEEKARTNENEYQKIMDVNYYGCKSIIDELISLLNTEDSRFITVITSVAGDRIKEKNATYGSAKRNLSNHLKSLRSKLSSNDLKVLDVKPGFVVTKMTDGLEFPSFLSHSSKEVAQIICKATGKSGVIYAKWYWRYIMMTLNLIPEFLFKKLKL